MDLAICHSRHYGKINHEPDLIEIISKLGDGKAVGQYNMAFTTISSENKPSIEDFLKSKSVEYRNNDGYLFFKPTDYYKALQLIWDCKPNGWQDLKPNFIRNNVCSELEL